MKLLVATDGSDNALRSVAYAADLLEKMTDGGSITLITVQDDAALQRARRFVGKQTVDEYLHELAEADIAGARELLDRAGVEYATILRIGQPAHQIVAAGEAEQFDMIVLGSKGRSTLKDLVVGSIARQIIELAKIPVLLVR